MDIDVSMKITANKTEILSKIVWLVTFIKTCVYCNKELVAKMEYSLMMMNIIIV